jgi:arylsulfatase A-like enzyme
MAALWLLFPWAVKRAWPEFSFLSFILLAGAVWLAGWLLLLYGWRHLASRKAALSAAGFWLIAVLAAFFFPSGDAAVPRPNLFLIVIDTLRADALGCYGNQADTSPNIDNIAREGVIFTDAQSPSPWTVPAHGSLFTGVSPLTHQAIYRDLQGMAGTPPLNPELKTLAGLLATQGYETFGITCNGLVNKPLGFAQGFDYYSTAEHLRGNPSRYIRFWEPWGAILRIYFKSRGKEFPAHASASLDVQRERLATDAAIDYLLNRRDKDRPVFFFINLLAPHHPYDPPAEYRKRFEPEGQSFPMVSLQDLFLYFLDRQNPPEIDWEQTQKLYWGEIAYCDSLVKELWNVMDQQELLDSASFVITSDHGESFGDLPYHSAQHNYLMEETILRVPLILWEAELTRRGMSTDSRVQLQDVFYYLLRRGGLNPPQQLEGQQIVDLSEFKQPGRPRRVAVYGSPPYDFLKPNLGEHYSDLKDMWTYKYIAAKKYMLEQENWRLVHVPELNHTELYSLQSDESSRKDVASNHPDQVKKMRQELQNLIERWKVSLEKEEAPDEETLEQMRALGYL